jgi:two-component system response regulator YesN
MKEFWDSLQKEILLKNQIITPEDIYSYNERSFIFFMFYRGCSQGEILAFQNMLDISNNGYLMLVDLNQTQNNTAIDVNLTDRFIANFIRNQLSDTRIVIGPNISNRIIVLITTEETSFTDDLKREAYDNAKKLIESMHRELALSIAIGIGNLYSIESMYTSFIEALRSIRYCQRGQSLHVTDIGDHAFESRNFDYILAQKQMIEAIRLQKATAYDYFVLLMNLLSPLNDETKRNRILEILVLANQAKRIDEMVDHDFIHYISLAQELSAVSGKELEEWAYRTFILITGHVASKNTINYTNKIVTATREYLEAHYTEDISLENVAEQVNISPQYFSKLIKKTTGFNFVDWLSMLRVRKAKELLSNSNLTVKEVCFLVGYKDPNYFSRIFKKRLGITPSEFVKSRINNMN